MHWNSRAGGKRLMGIGTCPATWLLTPTVYVEHKTCRRRLTQKKTLTFCAGLPELLKGWHELGMHRADQVDPRSVVLEIGELGHLGRRCRARSTSRPRIEVPTGSGGGEARGDRSLSMESAPVVHFLSPSQNRVRAPLDAGKEAMFEHSPARGLHRQGLDVSPGCRERTVLAAFRFWRKMTKRGPHSGHDLWVLTPGVRWATSVVVLWSLTRDSWAPTSKVMEYPHIYCNGFPNHRRQWNPSHPMWFTTFPASEE